MKRSIKKIFQKSDDDQMSSLKHSKSVPYGLSSEGRMREPRPDPSKAVYRGKTPLKTSDIIYIEQAPGVLDKFHAQMSQDTSFHPPTRAHFDTRADLLDKFPNLPQPSAGPTRNALRTTSLNSKSIRPQLPIQDSPTGGQHITDRERSIQAERARAKSSTTRSYTPAPPVPTTRSPRPIISERSIQAERARAKSSTTRSYTPTPPVPTTHSPRPIISRSTHSSRPNLRHVPSHVAIPSTAAPDHGQSHTNYHDFLKEQDPAVIRKMINNYPIAPLRIQGTPAHLLPIRFDMEDPHQSNPFSSFVRSAIKHGRPLDARAGAGGQYRRIINPGDPKRHHSEDRH